MVVIGLIGGVASGKSFVAERFRQRGAEIIDADRMGHEVLCEGEVEAILRERWGRGVIGSDGHVDRAALAKIVFAPPPEGPIQLAFLEQVSHRRIEERCRRRIAELSARGTVKGVVLDAPLLLKAGWVRQCDKIVFVRASREVRLGRALSRGWTEEGFAAREAAQESLYEKRNLADWVISNSGLPEQTYAQVDQFWDSLD